MAMTFFSCNVLKCGLINNQEYKVIQETINSNSNEPSLCPYSILVNKYQPSICKSMMRCNNVNDPHAKLCVPVVIKDTNIKVLNIMSTTNATRHIKQHETCKSKYRLDASACNDKQCWNNDKC